MTNPQSQRGFLYEVQRDSNLAWTYNTTLQERFDGTEEGGKESTAVSITLSNFSVSGRGGKNGKSPGVPARISIFPQEKSKNEDTPPDALNVPFSLRFSKLEQFSIKQEQSKNDDFPVHRVGNKEEKEAKASCRWRNRDDNVGKREQEYEEREKKRREKIGSQASKQAAVTPQKQAQLLPPPPQLPALQSTNSVSK